MSQYVGGYPLTNWKHKSDASEMGKPHAMRRSCRGGAYRPFVSLRLQAMCSSTTTGITRVVFFWYPAKPGISAAIWL